MPKSKKPRRKRQPRPAMVYCFRKADIDDVREIVIKIETKARIKLGFGNSSLEDLREMRDLMNAVVFASLHRDNIIKDKESKECIEFIVETGAKLAELSKKEPPYVCTADQLNSIKEALSICTDFANDSLDNCPNKFLNEFNGALLVRDSVIKTQRFTVSKKIVDIAVHEAAVLNLVNDPKEYAKEYDRIIKLLKQLVIDANTQRKD